MPQIAEEFHGRRHERVVFWELEFCWENAAFVGCSLGSFYERFPDEEVIFVDGARCYAGGRV